jgi:hypothetical protein
MSFGIKIKEKKEKKRQYIKRVKNIRFWKAGLYFFLEFED